MTKVKLEKPMAAFVVQGVPIVEGKNKREEKQDAPALSKRIINSFFVVSCPRKENLVGGGKGISLRDRKWRREVQVALPDVELRLSRQCLSGVDAFEQEIPSLGNSYFEVEEKNTHARSGSLSGVLRGCVCRNLNAKTVLCV